MSRLNEIKKIRYKLRNSDLLVLSKEKIEFLCDWAEKGLVAIPKTKTTVCEWCDSGIDTASVMSADMMMRFVRPVNYCPNCGRRLEKRHET